MGGRREEAMRRSIVGLVFVAAGALSTGGCYPKGFGDVSVFFMTLLGATPKSLGTKKAVKPLKATLDVNVSGKVGGLTGGLGLGPGDYQVTLGSYGSFSGNTKIHNQRFATVKDSGSAGLISAVEGMIADGFGATDVVITKASAKISAHETPGGVKAVYSGKITFQGTATIGSQVGEKIKGTIKAGHTY
jgi:hypothetical protein